MSQDSISGAFWSASRGRVHQHQPAASSGCGCGPAEDGTAKPDAASSSSCCGPEAVDPGTATREDVTV